ncbi:MAG TPA: phosphatase PAP2 family protein [Roseiarcus sp.]|jgi:hypothetical protein|nr:phosphatase PAP2 family protein [Roseiarcus sp.]
MMIRNGEWADFDFAHVEGIISFPSFHTTLAILLMYAARHHRWLLAVLAPLNMLLIAATLSVGGTTSWTCQRERQSLSSVSPPRGSFDSNWLGSACELRST